MNKISLVLASVVASLATIGAQADGLKIGVPSYGGTGCPAGSASVSLSPDQQTMSILFDQYVVEAGGVTGKTIDRKGCDVAIPVQIPNGYSIAIFQVDYRGFNAIPRGGRSQFNVEYFFAGQRGPSYTKTWMGPVTDNYTLSNTLAAQALVWSPCGASTILRSNSNMYTVTNSLREDTMSTVDSADITAGLIYHIQWARCR